MKGGERPGAGRKPKVDEEKIRNLAISAIEKRHGSIEEGFGILLSSNEPSLIKFVWEHAVGKPREKMNINSHVQLEQITGMQFTLPS